MTSRITFIKLIWKTFLVNCVATAFVILIDYLSGPKNAFSTRNLITSIIYSFSIGSFCSLAVYLLTRQLVKYKLGFRILSYVLALSCAVFFGLIFANTIHYFFGYVRYEDIVPLNWQILAFPLAIGLIFGGGAFFYEGSQTQLFQTEQKLQQKELDEANAKNLATEARLASLESRIHPHFLFNTLNSIAALIREDSILAEKTVEKLSALLRYSLESNAKSLVSLDQELEITEKYLEIEQIRFDKRLAYQIECEPRFLQTKIPPLSLQTLVENSIKHVAAKTSGQTEIKVIVKPIGEAVEIEVYDNGAGFSNTDLKENHGLDILRQRFETIFGTEGNLQIVGNGKVILKLPN